MSCATIPPILASIIARLTAAVPARARTTFLDLLLGAAATKGSHVNRRHPGRRPLAWLEHILLVSRAGALVMAADLGRLA